MPADPSSSPALRASDADRDQVIELLRAAVTDGRLDSGEFDERMGAALAARTVDALTPLTADLIAAPGSGDALAVPRAAGRPSRPPSWSPSRRSTARCAALAISTDAGDDTPETLHVRLVGKMKHGRIGARWVPPRGRSAGHRPRATGWLLCQKTRIALPTMVEPWMGPQ